MPEVTPTPVKLPVVVTDEIRDYVSDLKADRTVKTSLQDVYGWMVQAFLADKKMQEKFTDWLDQPDDTDWGEEKLINFRMPAKLDLDMRIALGKLGYRLGRRLTIRQLFLFMSSSFVSGTKLRGAYERHLRDRGRPKRKP